MVVDVLCNWYSKLYYSVKWNSALSARFAACSGVRQGSCLSPATFNVFMKVGSTGSTAVDTGRTCLSLVGAYIITE